MENVNQYAIKDYASTSEREARNNFVNLLKESPIPDDQLLANIGLYINSKTMSRILFMDHMYRQIRDVMGVVMEFGTRWGPNASQFAALRGIYEPFNRHRKIIAFDTFTGFPDIKTEDGKSTMMEKGHLTCTDNYDDYLEKIMKAQEEDNPISHIKKYEIVKGNAVETFPEYLERNPETIVALAYFDFDIYEPTKKCLELIKPRLTKGSILGFDELNDPDSPGETLALMEIFGLNNIKLKRYPYTSRTSYFVVE